MAGPTTKEGEFTEDEIRAHYALVSCVFAFTCVLAHLLIALIANKRDVFIHEGLFGPVYITVLCTTMKSYSWSTFGRFCLWGSLFSSPLAFGPFWSESYRMLFILGMFFAIGLPISNAIGFRLWRTKQKLTDS